MRIVGVASIVVLVTCAACSGGKSKSSPPPPSSGYGTLSRLPKSTDPVRAAFQAASTTGTRLVTAGQMPWGGASLALCQQAQATADVLTLAALNDASLCYAGVTETAGLASYVYDGSDQFVDITGLPFGAVHVKASATRDANGNVSSVKTYICNGNAQSSYLSMTIDSSGHVSVTSTDIVVDSGTQRLAYGRVVTTGTIDADGAWTSKQMVGIEQSHIPSATATMDLWASFTQDPLSLASQYDRVDEGASSVAEFRATSALQILGADSLSTFALGDGSAGWAATVSSNGAGVLSSNAVVSWNGDTRAPVTPASSGDYFATVAGATLPAPAAVSSTSSAFFQSGETWNCTPTGTVQSVPFSSLQNLPATQACSQRYQMPPIAVDCSGAVMQ